MGCTAIRLVEHVHDEYVQRLLMFLIRICIIKIDFTRDARVIKRFCTLRKYTYLGEMDTGRENGHGAGLHVGIRP